MKRNSNTSLRRCDGITRRDVLRIASLGPLGLGLTDLIDRRASAKAAKAATAKSCILLWLDGGPSHLETFDLKPNAPAEVRGPFNPIATNVSGIDISELLPNTAKVCNHLAIVRSMTSPLGEHGLANQYLMTGYKPTPVLQYPSYGAVISRFEAERGVLPSNIAIPEARSNGAGYLGKSYEPFETGGDPSKSDFQVRDLEFFPGVDEHRIARRREFLSEFDAAQSQIESNPPATNDAFEKAYRMVTSKQAKDAFKLDQEKPALREQYGPRMFGQSCLLARRLVERGVSFVTVNNTGWDTHENLSLALRDGYSGAKVGVGLVPTFDMGFSALVNDLSQRGMLDETLVIAMGEFGRTPKLNTRGGRDHWPRVFSVVLAGGGVTGGQVIGSSDRVGESPEENPYSPADLAHTIYKLLGIDPNQELHTADGRPIRISQESRPIRELVT